MKIWIDLANSPHPLLFAPVSRRFEHDGHEVLITVRDNAQTLPLAQERWPELDVIGGESPEGRGAKAQTIAHRVVSLRRWARARCPDVALSHNSYAQIVAARSLQIPAVTAMDYEHQPINHLAFRLADTVLLPAVIPLATVRRQGASPTKTVRYPGLKEELYIGDFEADPEILSKVGIERRAETIVVVARTPPIRATYHHFANPLFSDALRAVCSHKDAVCVALARHTEQIAAIERLELPRCVVTREAFDSRSLMYASDVMIGAGGTMTREAALMGIPTWSLFAGKPSAVDAWLEHQGLLSHATSAAQFANLERRRLSPRTPSELRQRAAEIEQVIVAAAVSAVGAYPPRRRGRMAEPRGAAMRQA